MSAAASMGARLSRDGCGRASQRSAASAFVNRSTAAALSIATASVHPCRRGQHQATDTGRHHVIGTSDGRQGLGTLALVMMLFRSLIGVAMVCNVSRPSPVPRIFTVPKSNMRPRTD